MAYSTPPDFTPFDVLTAAELDILSANDISFNDGTGLPVGSCVQVADTLSTAVATGTTVMVIDDTIPQSGEGIEFMTCAITPRSATNKLVIEAVATLSHSTNVSHLVMALFQDSTVNALAADGVVQVSTTSMCNVKLYHSMTAGTTSSTTFKIRCGSNVAGTTTFNGLAGARIFGAITKSAIVIREYTV